MTANTDDPTTGQTSEAERDLLGGSATPELFLAGRFAAKEAVMKVLGTGWAKGVRFRDIEVLREISLRVKECLRASDVATRFGGEEFALLLPQTDAAEACNLAERIRLHVAEHRVPAGDREALNVTVSIGVSELEKDSLEDPGAQLISRADSALYRAKRQGRNRVELAVGTAFGISSFSD